MPTRVLKRRSRNLCQYCWKHVEIGQTARYDYLWGMTRLFHNHCYWERLAEFWRKTNCAFAARDKQRQEEAAL